MSLLAATGPTHALTSRKRRSTSARSMVSRPRSSQSCAWWFSTWRYMVREASARAGRAARYDSKAVRRVGTALLCSWAATRRSNSLASARARAGVIAGARPSTFLRFAARRPPSCVRYCTMNDRVPEGLTRSPNPVSLSSQTTYRRAPGRAPATVRALRVALCRATRRRLSGISMTSRGGAAP